jgi:hypothetical protein
VPVLPQYSELVCLVAVVLPILRDSLMAVLFGLSCDLQLYCLMVVLFCSVLSCGILCCLVLPLGLARHVSASLVLSNLYSSLVLLCLVLARLVFLSWPDLSRLLLSCPSLVFLSYLALACLALSCPTFSCLV